MNHIAEQAPEIFYFWRHCKLRWHQNCWYLWMLFFQNGLIHKIMINLELHNYSQYGNTQFSSHHHYKGCYCGYAWEQYFLNFGCCLATRFLWATLWWLAIGESQAVWEFIRQPPWWWKGVIGSTKILVTVARTTMHLMPMFSTAIWDGVIPQVCY